MTRGCKKWNKDAAEPTASAGDEDTHSTIDVVRSFDSRVQRTGPGLQLPEQDAAYDCGNRNAISSPL
jgi:hypothetical protein